MLRSALLASLLLAALLTGCAKSTGIDNSLASATRAETSSSSALELYNSKQYPEALTRAEQDMSSATGRDHEVAQLTAGLSAYANHDSIQAKTYLQPLIHSSDPRIAGRAEAVLGQIAEQEGNHTVAADMFKRASSHLDGDDSARASIRAGNSLTSINKPAEAAAQYRVAAKQADSPAVKKTADKLSEPGPFSIQVGAFTSRASADKKVQQMRPATLKVGLGAPRIVPDSFDGKPGFAVQIGMFSSRAAASAAKTKLGAGQFLIVAAN
jgi:tetratricopeptide (TPR) repeat protein